MMRPPGRQQSRSPHADQSWPSQPILGVRRGRLLRTMLQVAWGAAPHCFSLAANFLALKLLHLSVATICSDLRFWWWLLAIFDSQPLLVTIAFPSALCDEKTAGAPPAARLARGVHCGRAAGTRGSQFQAKCLLPRRPLRLRRLLRRLTLRACQVTPTAAPEAASATLAFRCAASRSYSCVRHSGGCSRCPLPPRSSHASPLARLLFRPARAGAHNRRRVRCDVVVAM